MPKPTTPEFLRPREVLTNVKEFSMDALKVFNILSESDKTLIHDRIYEIGFLEEVGDELRCIECGKLALSHHIASCNHKLCCFCKLVDQISNDLQIVYDCKQCKIPKHRDMPLTRQDPAVELKLLALRVTCPNYDKGCKYTSTLMELPGHIRECDQTIDLEHKKIVQDELKEPNEFKQFLEAKMRRLENRFSLLQETMTTVLSKEFQNLNKAIEGQRTNFDDHLRVIDEAYREVNDRLDLTDHPAINSDIVKKDPFQEKDEILRERQLSFFEENFKSTDFQPLRCLFPPTSTVFTWVINNVSTGFLAEDTEYYRTVSFQLNDHPVLLQTEFRFPNGHISSQFRKPADKSLSDWLVPPYPRVTYSIGVPVIQKSENGEENEEKINIEPNTEPDQVTEMQTSDVAEEIKAEPTGEPDQVTEKQKSDKKDEEIKPGPSKEPDQMTEMQRSAVTEEIKAEPTGEPDQLEENPKSDKEALEEEEKKGEELVLGAITVAPITEPHQVSDIQYVELEEIAHVTEIAFKEQRESLQVDWYACCFGQEVIKKAIENDCLTVTICVDFPHLLDKPTSMNGVLYWQLPHFTDSIKNAKGKHDIRYSPYFYTGERGFRMQAELNNAYMLNFVGLPNPHLQPIPLRVRCLTGEFDASVPDDFELSVTVGILDRKENIIPMSQEVSRNAACELQLLTLEQLQIYLKDDVLKILISVVGYE